MSESRSTFDSTSLLLYLWKRRLPITLITVLAAVGSIVVSLTLEEKFLSAVVVYPAKSSSVAFTTGSTRLDNVMLFGEEEEAEQMLQIMASSQIRDKIINNYNLWEHYDLDSTSAHSYTKMKETYGDLVNIRRTKFGSVNIEVLDKSADTAAYIANDIAAYYDTVRNRMLRERSFPAFQIVQREFEDTKTHIQELVDTLTDLSIQGVEFPNSQSFAEFRRGWANAIINKPSAVKQFEQKLEMQAKFGSKFSAYIEELEHATKLMVELEEQYKQKKSDYENALSHKFTVEQAYPADKKSYPVRWLIVVMSTASAFFFAIFLLVALDKIRELRAIS